MEAAMAMEADSWLEKKADGLEHQYSLRPEQLGQSVDDMGLLPAAEEPADAEQTDADADSATSPFRVTMYQCAQCKTTFSTLEMCVNHQCSVAAASSAADSTQPQRAEHAQQEQQQQPEQQQQTVSQEMPDIMSCNYRWGQHDTLALLEILTSSVDKFGNPNIKRKFIWKDTCDQMIEKGFNVSQLQCENRWKTLKAMWRKSQSSGSAPPFYREMCEIAEQYPQLMVDPSLGGADTARPERPAPAVHGKTNWSREASLTMLALLKARHQEYSDPSIKRRSLWSEISEAMHNINMEYTAEQCEGRMKTLLQAYRRAQARWDLTGEGAESDCYYQVDELIRLIPELAGSVAGRAAAEGSTLGGQPRRPAQHQRRRRLGRAARQRDLLTWLDGWLQEQRRWDEGVQAALRAQHTERMRVLTEIRDELRTGGSRAPQTRAPPSLPQRPHVQLPTQTPPAHAQDDTVVAQVFLA